MPLSGNLTQNYTQTLENASRTLVIGDAFNLLYSNNGALVFTVPPDVFGDGVQISLCDFDDGAQPVFAPGAGVTLESNGGLGPTAQFTIASIISVPFNVAGLNNTWIVIGSV